MPLDEMDDVQLESPAVLAQLLMAWPEIYARGTRGSRPAQAPPAAPARLAADLKPVRQPRTACSCGECARCRDNARWNRVFEEKFADPAYYSGIVVRHSSSLARL